MKEIIKELYGIEAITFIKVSNRVYRIKTLNNDYALKYIEQTGIESIIEKLLMIKIDTFVYPLKNNFGQYTSSYEGVNFIVLPWVEEENVMMRDLKLKFFLNALAELHNRSFYTLRVNDSFFEETYDFIANKIDKTTDYLEKYMQEIERLDYKSPSQWLYILNYPVYMEAISKANKALDDFKEKSKDKSSIRMAFTYNNFDYKHIILKQEKILGIENVELAPPIYDVFYTFNTLDEGSVDTKLYYEKYFKKFILDEYEKEWLLALLYIPKIDNLSNNEVSNIVEVSSSLNYIRYSQDIAKIIKEQKVIQED